MAVSALLGLQQFLQALKPVSDPMLLEGHGVHTLHVHAAGLRICLGTSQSIGLQHKLCTLHTILCVSMHSSIGRIQVMHLRNCRGSERPTSCLK